MAAVGSLTTRTEIGQFCSIRHQVRAGRYQAVTQLAASDRSQSAPVSKSEPAAMARQGFHRIYRYPAWGREKLSISEYSRGLEIQSRWQWGSFLKGQQSGGQPSPNASNNNFGDDVRVDTRARAREEPAPWQDQEKEANQQDRALSVVEVKDAVKAEKNADVAEKALDKGSNVATSALDKVGDVLRGTGLEVNLDVGLKELTIKELVLRDLGLVLEIKTKPQPQPQPEPEPPLDP